MTDVSMLQSRKPSPTQRDLHVPQKSGIVWLLKQWRVGTRCWDCYAVPHASTHTFFMIVIRGDRDTKRSVGLAVLCFVVDKFAKLFAGVCHWKHNECIRVITPLPIRVVSIEVDAAY